MSKIFGSVLAITVASVAAIAATTAMLNSAHRIGPGTETTAGAPALPPVPPPSAPAPQSEGKPATPEPGAKPAPAGGAGDAAPGAPTGAGATPADASAEPDQNPYDDIAPEELPPDLQYNADSSVSFPTNI